MSQVQACKTDDDTNVEELKICGSSHSSELLVIGYVASTAKLTDEDDG